MSDGGHLKGADAIAEMFGVSRGTVKKWYLAGAPILYLGKKYQANYTELWAWVVKKHCQKKPVNYAQPIMTDQSL